MSIAFIRTKNLPASNKMKYRGDLFIYPKREKKNVR